jgi:hypothetical protein
MKAVLDCTSLTACVRKAPTTLSNTLPPHSTLQGRLPSTDLTSTMTAAEWSSIGEFRNTPFALDIRLPLHSTPQGWQPSTDALAASAAWQQHQQAQQVISLATVAKDAHNVC